MVRPFMIRIVIEWDSFNGYDYSVFVLNNGEYHLLNRSEPCVILKKKRVINVKGRNIRNFLNIRNDDCLTVMNSVQFKD